MHIPAERQTRTRRTAEGAASVVCGPHCRCNPVQGATAFLAFTATLATWNLQLTESKGCPRVRIPLSPSPHPHVMAQERLGWTRLGRSALGVFHVPMLLFRI